MKSINEFAERNYLYVALRTIITLFFISGLLQLIFNSKVSVQDSLEVLIFGILIVAFMVKNAIKNIQFSVTINPDLNPRASATSSARKF